MFYIVLLSACITLCSVKYIIRDKLLSHFLVFSSVFLLWGVSALRLDIGTDYVNYVKLFNEINSITGTGANVEISFYFIVKLCHFLGASPQLMFAIYSAIISITFFYRKEMRNIWGVIAFICIIFLPSFSLIRQSAAVGFICISAFFLLNEKIKKSYILLGVACLFHLSAILFFPVIIFRKIKINFFLGLTLVLMFFIVSQKLNIAEVILNSSILQKTKYGVYNDYNSFIQQTVVGSGLGVILKIFPSLIILILASVFFRSLDETGKYKVKVLCLMNYAYMLSVILSLQIHIFGRIVDFFMFVPLITFVSLNAILINKSNLYFIRAIFVALLLTNFILIIYKNPSSAIGGLGIYPYQSILFN
jgi:hypothetical protein